MDLPPDVLAGISCLPGHTGLLHPGFYGSGSEFTFGERYPLRCLPLFRPLFDDSLLVGFENKQPTRIGLNQSLQQAYFTCGV